MKKVPRTRRRGGPRSGTRTPPPERTSRRCGETSPFGQKPRSPGATNYLELGMVNGRTEGLLGKDYFDRFPKAVAGLRGWLRTGQL